MNIEVKNDWKHQTKASVFYILLDEKLETTIFKMKDFQAHNVTQIFTVSSDSHSEPPGEGFR